MHLLLISPWFGVSGLVILNNEGQEVSKPAGIRASIFVCRSLDHPPGIRIIGAGHIQSHLTGVLNGRHRAGIEPLVHFRMSVHKGKPGCSVVITCREINDASLCTVVSGLNGKAGPIDAVWMFVEED